MTTTATTVGAVVGVVGILLMVAAPPVIQWLVTWPYDESIGRIPIQSQEELKSFYENKHALVVGGTRGTGFGTALVLAKSGAHVTIVGRRETTGLEAVQKLEQEAAQNSQQQFQYLKGDLGSVRTTKELLERLKESDKRYDLMVVSAGIWPDWTSPRNEDGLEKMFGVIAVGRFLL